MHSVGLTAEEIDSILNYIVSRAQLQPIDFLWRPFLPDAKDDCVLDCAVNGQAEAILTFNKRHFSSVPNLFGIPVVTPREFLIKFGGF